VSAEKDITILALTKMHGGVCTAGIDAGGHWVRPVRPAPEAPSNCQTVTDYCLLPLDFFHGGQSHLVNLGVTRCALSAHAPQPPHIEDWALDLKRKPRFLRKLDEAEQAAFLARHVERDLSPLRGEAAARSLMLIEPQQFSLTFSPNKTGDDVTVRASFVVNDEACADLGCTDLRLRALGRRLLERSGGRQRTLTEADFERQGKQKTYFSVGLSRLYQGKHWLILVGVHALPELAVEIDYAKL
jgi:hypothetical protein